MFYYFAFVIITICIYLIYRKYKQESTINLKNIENFYCACRNTQKQNKTQNGPTLIDHHYFRNNESFRNRELFPDLF